jgi:hypothetical protein
LPGVILAAFGGLRDDGTGAAGRVIIPIQKEGGPVDDPLERFAGLYDLYYRNVLRYALQHAEQGSAEDVVSEAFLIAWRRLADVQEPPLPWRGRPAWPGTASRTSGIAIPAVGRGSAC